jgi:hypothetical protein
MSGASGSIGTIDFLPLVLAKAERQQEPARKWPGFPLAWE